MNKRTVSIYFSDILCVALIVLKLTGTIDWPWVWVLAPIWIPLLIILVIVFIIRRR